MVADGSVIAGDELLAFLDLVLDCRLLISTIKLNVYTIFMRGRYVHIK